MKINKLNSFGVTHLLPLAIVVIGIGAIGTYLLIGSEAATACVGRNFSQGSRGVCVQYIQVIVNSRAAVSPKLVTDSLYGPQTTRAVKQFEVALASYYVSAGPPKFPTNGTVNSTAWTALCIQAARIAYFNGMSSTVYKDGVKAGCQIPIASESY